MNGENSKIISLNKAILDNDMEEFKYLIKKDVDSNLSDSKGLKPLHAAIMTNNTRFLELLLEKLTNLNKIESDIYTWQLAIMLDNSKMWNLLRKKRILIVTKELQNVSNSQGETIVHYSARYRSFKILNECIQAKLNINDVDSQGYSPLHLAVINNDTKIVELLLKSEANVNAKTVDGRSAIHFAVKYQCIETLLMLLGSQVDVNDQIATNGSYPLHIAVENNDERTVNLLLRAGGDIHCKDKDGKNLLHVAVENQHEGMVDMLLKKGVDVNARFGEEEESVIELALISKKCQIISAILNYNPDLNSKNKDGLNALFVAIENKCIKAIEEIVLLKPDFSAVTYDNCSLLHYAFIYKVEGVVNYFLENNICINAIDDEGKNALHYAAETGLGKIVSELISKGLDVNSRTKENKTPLHFAVTTNCDVVQVLLNNGADINAEDTHKKTPLFYSVDKYQVESGDQRERMIEIAKLLIDKKANVILFDSDGNTPLYYLVSYWYVENLEKLVSSFIQLGADINNINNRNDNVLHIYLKDDYEDDVIQYFLDNGVNVNQVNNSNETPLEVYLKCYPSNSVVELLINKGAVIMKNKMGANALHLACDKFYYNVEHRLQALNDLITLLKPFADINARNVEGKTPLHVAVIKNCIPMVEALLSNKANVNVKDMFENSPLCYAIFNKNLSIIKLLLHNRACTSDKHRGLSIYDLAEQTGNKHIYHMVMFFFKCD